MRHRDSELIASFDVYAGILPRDGRKITFKQMNQVVREHYNFAPTFCWYVPNTIAGILGRDYETGVFDLSDIDVHNGIEHDASFTSTYSFIFHVYTQLTALPPRTRFASRARSIQTGARPYRGVADIGNRS